MSLFCSIWFSKFEAEFQAGTSANAKVKVNQGIGILELGKIDKVYLRDPEVRDILQLTELDSDRAKDIQGHKLRLITSVVYSERFKLGGKRFHEVMKNRLLIACLSRPPYTAQWQRPLDCAQSAKITSPLRTSKSEANRWVRTPLYSLLFFFLLNCWLLLYWHILIALMCYNKHLKKSSLTSIQRQPNLSTTATKLVVVYMYRLYLFTCVPVSREWLTVSYSRECWSRFKVHDSKKIVCSIKF